MAYVETKTETQENGSMLLLRSDRAQQTDLPLSSPQRHARTAATKLRGREGQRSWNAATQARQGSRKGGC